MEKIEIQELENKSENQFLVNVLPPEQYKQVHIEGSINACIYELAFNKKIKELIPNFESTVVVYGKNDDFLAADKAYFRLKELGYEYVYVLDGGIDTWIEDGLPVTKAEEKEHECSLKNHAITLDVEKSKIRWTGRNLANSHWGSISISDGNLLVQDDLLVDGEIVLDMKSIACSDLTPETGSKGLVTHLFSDDFWAVDEFPVASIKILSSAKKETATWGKPNYDIIGEIEIRGIRKTIEFEALIGYSGKCKFVAQAQIKLDRTIFGSQYGSGRFFEYLGKHMVADLIELEATLIEK